MMTRSIEIIYRIFIAIVCIVSLPVVIIIGIAIGIFSGLPVFFQQKRIGMNGKPFTIYKFRTMVVNAEKQQKKLRDKNEANGPAFKIRNDPRFTPIGKPTGLFKAGDLSAA